MKFVRSLFTAIIIFVIYYDEYIFALSNALLFTAVSPYSGRFVYYMVAKERNISGYMSLL
jgi:hypothetical protein